MKNLLRLAFRYKRLLLLFVVFFLFFAVVETKAQENERDYVNASSNPLQQGFARFEGTKGGLNSESVNLVNLRFVTGAMLCDSVGVGCPINPDIPVDEQVYKHFNRSVLGMTSQTIGLSFAVPPAGVGPFIADAAMRAGFVDKAYAQGIGFAGLTPLIPVWRAFRNATYAVMILVLLVFGVLIMLRRQIDPQTVITIQNSLPRIVVTLVLITFSYAIAGFIIDLMYVAMLLIINLFSVTGIIDLSNVDNAAQKFLTGGSGTLFMTTLGIIPLKERLKAVVGGGAGTIGWKFVGGKIAGKIATAGIGKAAGGFIGGLAGPVGAFIGLMVGGFFIDPLIGVAQGQGFLENLKATLSAPFSLLFWLFMAAVFIFAFLRLLFLLISSYVQILVNIVFAPLKLAADVVPGGEGFLDWITNLIGHVLVFPVTIAMILVGHAITKSADVLWTPPLILNAGPVVQSFIGLGIIMLIPNIAGSIREKFKATAPGGVTGGAVMGGMMRPVSSITSGLGTIATYRSAMPSKGSGGP